jgi:hypothetical protein
MVVLRLLLPALEELVRGISTGLVLAGGSTSCPSCAPHVSCPTFLCPDCVCAGGVARDSHSHGYSIEVLLAVGVAGIIFGLGVGTLLGFWTFTRGELVAAASETIIFPRRLAGRGRGNGRQAGTWLTDGASGLQ